MNEHTEKRVPLWAVAAVVGVFVLFICSALAISLIAPRLGLGRDEPLPTRAELVRSDEEGGVGNERAGSDDYPRFSDGTFAQHSNIEGLVQKVAGAVIREDTLYVDTWEGAPANAYFVEFVVSHRDKRTRNELLELAYVLLRELYYNYAGSLDSVSLSIHAYSGDEQGHCTLGVGLGREAASDYLPRQKPANLEAWFNALKRAGVYSDDAENEWQLAYGNDPDIPVCNLINWKQTSGSVVDAPSPERPQATPTRVTQVSCRERAGEYLQEIEPIVTAFSDQMEVASSTPRISLAPEIRELQRLRTSFSNIEPSLCVANSAMLIDLGMYSIIEGFLLFNEDADNEISSAFILEDGAENLSVGLEQLVALYEGRPTPEYDPVAALEARQAELEEAMGFGPTPEPAAAGTSIIVQSAIEDWEIGVERIEYAQEFSDGIDGTFRERASGRFAVLILNVTNLGTSSTFFFPFSAVELHDAAGNVYEVADMATRYAERHYGIVDSNFTQELIHPGESGRAVAVFDIPQGGGPYMLANLWSPLHDPVRLWVDIE